LRSMSLAVFPSMLQAVKKASLRLAFITTLKWLYLSSNGSSPAAP
jgi:hypothetical protein